MTDEPTDLVEEAPPLELDGSSVDDGERAPASNLTSDGLTREAALATAKQRQGLTVALVSLVGLGGAVMFWAAFVVDDARWDHFERAGTLILVPLLTLLGTAVGWYYRGEKRE